MRRGGGSVMTLLAVVFSLFVSAASAYALPSFEELKGAFRRSDAILLDRNGKVLHEMRVDHDSRRLDWTSLKDISPALVSAVIHSEDRRFYVHHGVDWRAVGTAAIKGLFDRGRGASTITMQLAALLDRGLRPGRSGRTLHQKWDQMKAASLIEKFWTKQEILEAYLNLVTFRGELQGISAASRGLFGKGPDGLEEAESSILGALIRSPNADVPDVAERACILSASMKAGPVCEDIKEIALRTLARSYNVRQREALAPHVARAMLDRNITSAVSTLDRGLQQISLESLKRQIQAVRDQNVRDGAVLVADNMTGEVLAYVGNTGGDSSAPYVDGVLAKRQAGSTLKPFLYATAFEKKVLTPASLISDEPLDVPTATGLYKPENYERDYKGVVSARTALASSLNVPAVKVISLTGVELFINKLIRLGFDRLGADDFYGPSVALGSADVSLYDLVNAYRVLANKGLWSELGYSKKGGKGRARKQRRVFSEEAAFLVSDILADRVARSITFGLENPISTRFRSSVKTGTSKDMRDNWCIGFSERYTVGVWVGNFGGGPMRNVSGVTGAALVWLEIINYLHSDESHLPVKPPAGLIAKKVSFGGIEPERVEWFIRGTEQADIISDSGVYKAAAITYPAQGTIIAMDPDIPVDQQRIFFEMSPGRKDLVWELNGRAIGGTLDIVSWRPEPGSYTLSLTDIEGIKKDSVDFVVKGD